MDTHIEGMNSSRPKNVKRELSPAFMEKLKTGEWKCIIDKVKNDHTLHFQIRDNYINIYYRGHNALKLEDNGKISCIDKKFYNKDLKTLTVDIWLDELSKIKNEIDTFIPNVEREFQQLVARENSFSKVSNDTDYFVIDTEFADSDKGSRIDMLAIKWASTSPDRRNPNAKSQLAIIEMKYGIDSLSNLEKHCEDILSIENMDMLKQTVISQFKQLRELDLIKLNDKGNTNAIDILDDNVEFILLLANLKPASTKLSTMLDNIKEKAEELKNKNITVKFATSNFMGYGLYANAMLSFDEFEKLYNDRKPKINKK